MKTVDLETGTVWLSVRDFAAKQKKQPVTIRQWCTSGFVVELGFLIHRDPTGHYLIGIPPSHQAYQQFA